MSKPKLGWKQQLQKLTGAATHWTNTSRAAELLAMPLTHPSAIYIRLRLAYLAGLRDGTGRKIDLITLDKHGSLTGKSAFFKK
mgnify:FL=1